MCAGSNRFTPSKKVCFAVVVQAEQQEAPERVGIGPAGYARVLEERLQLGRERESVRPFDVVEGLDPEPVAREEQLAPLVVGDREREHAGEVVDDVTAPLFEATEDDLACRSGR